MIFHTTSHFNFNQIEISNIFLAEVARPKSRLRRSRRKKAVREGRGTLLAPLAARSARRYQQCFRAVAAADATPPLTVQEPLGTDPGL